MDLPVVNGLEGWREMLLLPGGIFASPQQENAFCERVSQPAVCGVNRGVRADGADERCDAPGRDCQCGYYALYKRLDARDYKGNCVVKISAMGETEMHEIGFRCAQFRIDEVYVRDPELAEAARERLGIDIFIEEAPCKSESESSGSQHFLDQLQSGRQLQSLQEAAQKAMQDRLAQQFQPLIPNPSPFQQLGSGLMPGGPILTADQVRAAKKWLEEG